MTVLSAAADTVHAGSGSDYVSTSAKGATIWGGSGAVNIKDCDWTQGDAITVRGGSGALNFDQSDGALTFVGGSGSATINGESGSLASQGGSGALTVSGGSAGMRFVGGTGTATLSLTPNGASVQFGAGATTVTQASYGAADLYTFTGGHAAASDLISGFRAGTDKLVLNGVSVSSESVVGRAASVVLSDGSHLTLSGVSSLAGLFGPGPAAVAHHG